MKNFKKYFSYTIILLLLSFAILYSILLIFIATQADKDAPVKADAILVLGARSYIDGRYNPCLKARVNHAADLYKHNYAPKIIMSGGNDSEDNTNEAETMRKIALDDGAQSNDIILEKKATSTSENFSFSQILLKQNGLKSIIIVTEPFHMARAELVARRLGITYTVSPVKESQCWQQNKYLSKYFLKEPFAIILYKLQSKL